MKKLSFVLALLLALTLVFAACSPGTGSSAATGDASTADAAASSAAPAEGEEAAEEEAFFDPSLLQAKAIDDQTLEVTLVAPTPYFLELTAFPVYAAVPTHIIAEVGEDWATQAETLIGCGAYQLTEFVPQSHLKMEKNPNYWDAANVGPETIEFKLIEDSVAELNAFQTGVTMFTDNPPPEEIENLKSEDFFHSEPQMGTYYVSMNNQAEPFNDINVRKAFALAIDRDHIANVIGSGLYIPAGAWVDPAQNDATAGTKFRDVGGDWWDPSAEAYAANCDEARAALEEAGYPNGEGFPSVTYIYNDSGIHPAVAQALQNMWNEVLGVNVEIESQEWATFLETRKNGEYQLARDGWLNDYNDPVGELDLFITGGGNNNSQYSNPDYDALITQSKKEADQVKRFELLHQAEDMLRDDWVFAPVMYYGDPFLITPKLYDAGFWTSPLGYKYFMFVQGFEDLTVCAGPTTSTIDPALNSSVDGATYIIHMFDGLYRLDKNGKPEPALAESVDISDDQLTYTFHMREGVQFSDGTPITAQTIVDSWTRAIDPFTAADYSYMFESIAGYDAALGMTDEAA